MIEEVFTGLKLVFGPAIKDVDEGTETVGDNFFFRQESNYCAGTEPTRDFKSAPFDRLPDRTPLLPEYKATSLQRLIERGV